MEGDDRMRFCRACKLNVYNLSAMSRQEAETLIEGQEERRCVTYYQRRDGTVLTADCPVGVGAERFRFFRALSVPAAAFLAFFGCLAGAASDHGGLRHRSLRWLRPFVTVYERFVPPPMLTGVMIASPPPSNSGQASAGVTR